MQHLVTKPMLLSRFILIITLMTLRDVKKVVIIQIWQDASMLSWILRPLRPQYPNFECPPIMGTDYFPRNLHTHTHPTHPHTHPTPPSPHTPHTHTPTPPHTHTQIPLTVHMLSIVSFIES